MLYLQLFSKKKKERKKGKGTMARGLFPGQTCLSGCAMLGFPQLLGEIKSCFKGWSLSFMCTLCVGSYLVGWKKSELPKCSSHVSKWFLKSQSSGFLIPSLNCPSWIPLHILLMIKFY
jgi:hypothetical protein